MTSQYVVGFFIGWIVHAWAMRVRDRAVAKQRREKIARGLEQFNGKLAELNEKMKVAREAREQESPFVRPMRGRR